MKKKIFIPELYIYDLLKFESPEVLMKSEGLTVSGISQVRYQRQFVIAVDNP